jgi:hypothetical protein
MMSKKGVVFLLGLLLVVVLAGCSWTGGVLLPTVPTRVPGAELTRPVVPTEVVVATPTLAPTADVIVEPAPTAVVEPTPTEEVVEPAPTAVVVVPTATEAVFVPAVYPVVDAETGFVLGGWADGWLDPAETVVLLDRLPYRLYANGQPAGAVDGQPLPAAGGPCPQPMVRFDGAFPPGSIALLAAATWAPDARPVTEVAATTGLQGQVMRLLQTQGIAEPEVRLVQVLRADLEGDGLDELFVTALRLGDGSGEREVNAGDYALVALQPADGTPLVPLVLDVYLEAGAETIVTVPGVGGILDVNGDGRMEVVVRALRNGGMAATVFAGDGKALLPVVGMECRL